MQHDNAILSSPCFCFVRGLFNGSHSRPRKQPPLSRILEGRLESFHGLPQMISSGSFMIRIRGVEFLYKLVSRCCILRRMALPTRIILVSRILSFWLGDTDKVSFLGATSTQGFLFSGSLHKLETRLQKHLYSLTMKITEFVAFTVHKRKRVIAHVNK
jgi:hypothetical protein